MAKDIIVEFSGWCRISPKHIKFTSLTEFGTDGLMKEIDGVEWTNLSKEQKTNYVLTDVTAVQRDCTDSDYDTINCFTEDED